MTDNVAPASSSAPKKLIELLDYIEQTEKLTRKPQLTVPADFFLAYQDEIRGLPGVHFNELGEGVQIWMRIERLKESAPPDPGARLKPWVVLSQSAEKPPSLRETISLDEPGKSPRTLYLKDETWVQPAFDDYVRTKWELWSGEEKRRRQTIHLYNELFGLHQAIESEGTETALEVVWGIGLALWAPRDQPRIQYPLLTQLVEINLNVLTFAIELSPRDADTVLEIDPYVALDNQGVLAVEELWKRFREKSELTLSPFDTSSYTPVLKAAVGFLDASGQYWPDVAEDPENKSLPKATDRLTVTDSWVIFARKRTSSYLIQDLTRLRKNLEEAETVPDAPAALVLKPSGEVVVPDPVYYRGVSYSSAEEQPAGAVRELYFPKPYNEEQVTVAARLDQHAGVVVQGPPGTGKSHTIANIVCDYLARGKRVLVTSKGEPALAVLRDLIPESVRALTVSLLTQEREGKQQFEHAIQTIAAEVSRINPDQMAREVKALREHIDCLHQRLTVTDRDIAQWAKRQLSPITFQNRKMHPEELARFVVQHEAACGWLADPVPHDTGPAFTDSDIQELRHARRTVGTDLAYVDAALPTADDFPDGLGMLRIHHDLRRAREIGDQIENGELPPLANSSEEVRAKAAALEVIVRDGVALHEEIHGTGHAWVHGFHDVCRTRHGQMGGLEALCEEIRRLESERRHFVDQPVSVPPAAEMDVELKEALARLSRGKAPFLFPIGKTETRKKLAQITVSGLPPAGVPQWAHVERYFAFQLTWRALATRWNALAAELALPTVDPKESTQLSQLAVYQRLVDKIRRLVRDIEFRMPGMIETVFGPSRSVAPRAGSRDDLRALHRILEVHLTRVHLADAWNALDGIKAKLAGKTGGVVDRINQFLLTVVSNAAVSDAEVQNGWTALLTELRRLAALQGAFAEVHRVTSAIKRSGAPAWANALATRPVEREEDPLLPGNWIEAWNWRRAKSYLESIDGHHAFQELQLVRAQTESDLSRSYQKLVEQLTWLEVHRLSPPAVKSALQRYLHAMKNIGKGTGVRAVRYRKDAREAMLEAHRAVPCWIMPHYRVSETMPPEIGVFDLVIIDEASQSDLWALPCLLRGKKFLVVGDDKQVTPEGIGLEEAKIRDLKHRFLTEQVFGSEMTPEKSIYDLARVAFAGNLVMLREHFRCVEPIIAFSNREFYQNEIRPLRIPKVSERLDPPLVDVFIKGGYRDRNINRPEARAIVDEIKRIIEQPLFAKRTLGVVSLLGADQAHHIFSLIKDEIPQEEILERKITCGDARTFQGKERDIMLLSMVATPEQSITATRRDIEQRFNVAASRAKDRMYLFRSVERSELNKDDLKARLIAHFEQPFQSDPVKVRSLRERCESPFEQEMYDALTAKGYRVKPQLTVGAYRIDLVVEGAEDRRLAVECDGDQYHGPEKWATDAARQRVLERAGWTFWRCFASTFVINRQACLADVFGVLGKMGIEPIGMDGAAATSYTEHRVSEPPQAMNITADTKIVARPVHAGRREVVRRSAWNNRESNDD